MILLKITEMRITLLTLVTIVLVSSCKKNKETPPESLSENSVGASTCVAAFGYVEYGSLQPLYSEDCPSCAYVITVTNDASIVENPTDHSVLIRAGVQNFQVKFKITYNGGETNTVTRDVTVEAQDAIARQDDITYDEQLTVLGGFDYNSNGYVIAKTDNDYRLYKYYPGTDKWQGIKIQPSLMVATRISQPSLMNSDEMYYIDNMDMFYKYDFSSNTFSNLGTIPNGSAKINYSYNGKYYSGAGTLNDSIYEYDPATLTWSGAYSTDAGLISNGVKYTFPLAAKAYIITNTGGTYVLDYASQTFTAVSGVGYDFQTTGIFLIDGNLHFVTGSNQAILNTGTDQVNSYAAHINTCGTTLNSLESTFSHYSFFGVSGRGIAVNDKGDVFSFNPNY